MDIVATGGAGFIGGHLVDSLRGGATQSGFSISLLA